MKAPRRTALARGASCATLGLALALPSARPALAAAGADPVASYPDKPIRLIVPFTPGGGTDMVTRIVGQRLSALWNSPVVVENVPGAGGISASTQVARAKPDGYTLAVITPTQVINPSLYASLPFDPIKDFKPVVLMNRLQLMLVGSNDFAPGTVADLIAYAKANPGKAAFGSTGVGGSAHLAVELIKKMAGIDMIHVPYKGSSPAYADVIANRVQLLSNNIISTMPLVRSKQLKAIAVLGATRSPIAPEVPTVAESGLPGYDVSSWFGIVAPAATPQPVIDKLNRAIVGILREPETRGLMLKQGAEPIDGANAPADFGRLLASEKAKWADVIQSAGIKTQAVEP
ncbi:MAG: tripartite tricarboxylate transporter substrate binding protein [Pigmentiphaga sp.]|uniref:Bug family tripartite tricarboxylate transporter substrate binding protein n=1 Tax=Pigmentiphaga sp. TaxID=1977564 RepID=UPI0029B04DFD|nr:tripartite tricarboxylate transporter substrate binding protein [Pigmentiphaga sp.]MDX3905584.1 tripartite tricarboxylate transporter substrate binding protein [Pigmentiphaga sp.]